MVFGRKDKSLREKNEKEKVKEMKTTPQDSAQRQGGYYFLDISQGED